MPCIAGEGLNIELLLNAMRKEEWKCDIAIPCLFHSYFLPLSRNSLHDTILVIDCRGKLILRLTDCS